MTKTKKLRNALCAKGYGTEIDSKDSKLLIVKTTKQTGAISKKQVKAHILLDKAFLSNDINEQQSIIIKQINHAKANDKGAANL